MRDVPPTPWPALSADAISTTQVESWVLPAVFEKVRTGKSDMLSELRQVAALFLKFGGIEYDTDAKAGDKLNTFIQWVEQIIAPHKGSIIQLTVGDKGSYRCPSIREIVYMGEGAAGPGMRGFEEIVAAAKPAADAGCGGEDLAAIYYTGGTTGRSKGVMLSHRNFVFNSINYTATVPFDRSLHWLHGAPMFHIADANGLLTTTLHGGTHSFLPSFDVEKALAIIQDHRINYCLFVPTMINMMVNHPSLTKYDVSHPVRCQFGGSPMPEVVLRKAMQVLPSWTFINGYGMTELSPFVTGFELTADMAGGPRAALLKSCGHAAIGCQVRIVDDKGQTVPTGAVGQLLVRGDNVMQGYWNR